MKKIFRKLAGKNLTFTHICEVGVFLPEYSNVIDFIKKGIRTTLVEADPLVAQKIREYYEDYPVTVHAVAIFDHNGTIELSRAAQSTFVSSVTSSPAIVNDGYRQKETDVFTTECRLFSEIDTGDIDLISIDIEGCEWYVIEKMTSRPKVISVETHAKSYINPHMPKIARWMENNGYELWYKDLSDSVYVRSDQFKASWTDKLETAYIEARVAWKKFKQKLKRRI
ncbi:MAG: FkbM family methyltransferase [Chitinophagaceae bacterium]|nr:MAG: FkbM family methyltransferase [Chitinophagaceae bacterium]